MNKKTHNYKTLNGLITKTTQFTLNHFIMGRFHHINNNWVNFKVTPEVKTKIEELFKEKVGNLDLNINKTYGLFDRLIIEKKRNEKGFRCEYIAGQDYPSEIKYLRKLIREA